MPRLSAKTSVGAIPLRECTGADESSALAGLAASALLCCSLLLAWPDDVHAERACAAAWHAELIAVEGAVEVATPSGWAAATSGEILCDGDIVRTGPFGRASILVTEGTIMQVAPGSALRISATENATDSWYDVVVKVLAGVIHAISRDPRSLAFDTPFVNAGIEGTEFVVNVRPDGATVSVIEGEIALTNAAGTAKVTSGTSGFASRDGEPAAAADPDVLGRIDFMRRFAPIIDGELPAPDGAPIASGLGSADFHARRAASRLAVGAVREADEDLAAALSLEPEHADALALRALIALSDGDRERALDLAERAVDAAPDAPAPWLALSHAARAASDRGRALASAETAARVAPDHAYAWARVAELRLGAGDFRGAREAAECAVRLDPGLAYAHTVLGFAEQAGGSTAKAEASFRRAIEVDAADPYARLGLGLVLLRQGRRDAGREEVEKAVALDPTSSIIRSYVAKIYDEEDRGKLGAIVLEIAKTLDEGDSTGWYYDALRKQHENRLPEAFLDFRRSFAETDRRSVYGGALSLDEDLLARSAGIGRLHSALGFERLGLLAAWRSMFDDPDDYSGHRLAADLYAHRPRHQLARVNEVHQAIIRQPLNVTPFQAQLSEARPFVLDVAGPGPLAFHEYHPLVRDNGWSYQLSGVTAGHGTEGIDLAVNGLYDRASYNLAIFDFETEGFRPNNDFDERVLSAVTQLRPNAATTFTAELRSTDVEKGDLALRFDPEDYLPTFRESESVDYLLAGVHRRTARGAWLGTVIAEKADVEFAGLGAFSQSGSRRGTAFDLQHVVQIGAWNVTSGARYLDQEQVDELSGMPFPPSAVAGEPPETLPISVAGNAGLGSRHDVSHGSVYVYGNVELSSSVRATIGGNLEAVEGNNISRQRFGPKLGLMWDLSPRTTLRTAAFRTLHPPLVSKHNVPRTLEPTHVVGFNQQYFGTEGEEAWRYAVALDHEFAENLFAGIELSRRDIAMQFFTVDRATSETSQRMIHRDERSHLMYLYWLPTPTLSFAAFYEYDEFDGGDAILPEGFSLLQTHQLPLELNYLHPSGFSAGIEARLVDQSGLFSPVLDDQLAPERGEDRFWSVDLSLGYRLPARRGSVSLQVLNATDEEFLFQDIDPENPRLFPERTVQLGFTLSY